MKSLQLLKAVDSLSLTPSTTRRLLYLLVIFFVLCLFCASALYFWSRVSNGVSCQRRLMNDAADEMRRYFERRQILLERLELLLARDSSLPKRVLNPLRQLPRYERQWIALGENDDAWGLLLSGRELDELDRLGAGLLYVKGGERPVVSYLHGRFERRSMLPETVMEKLLQHSSEATGKLLWLAAPHDPLQRIYLFLAVHCNGETIWLGLELRGNDLSSALTVRFAGSYVLLDDQRRAVLGNGGVKVDGLDDCVVSSAIFGFCGDGGFPRFLMLSKALGDSGWKLGFYLPLRRLLTPYWSMVVACLLVWGCASFALVMLAWRVDRRLIGPARTQLRDLLQYDEFLRTTLDVAPIALCLLRCSDGSVVLENRLARCWFDQVEGRRNEGKRWIGLAGAANESGSLEVQGDDGRVLQLNFVPTCYKGEEVLFCACTDVSARMQTEQALRKTREILASTRESKRLFLSAMSRGVQAPLYRMLDSVECLRSAALNRKQRNCLELMQRSVINLQHLLNDIHSVSQLEEGRVVLNQYEFSPLALLRDVAQAHAPAAHMKGIDLYVCCASDLPERLRGDASLMRQVLDNLLDNAVKFTEDGFIALRTRLEGEGEGRRIVLQVSDTGCGITADQQPKLFQPFFQICGTAGSGLGLTISQHLVQLLGGTLDVVSERGLGSSFAVRLPLQCVESPSGMAAERFLSIPVYIRCRPCDLRNNLASWLQLHGGQPRLWQAGQHGESVLLECLLLGEQPIPEWAWKGPRIFACTELDKPLISDSFRQVSLYDLEAVGKAIRAAQESLSRRGSPSGIHPEPR